MVAGEASLNIDKVIGVACFSYTNKKPISLNEKPSNGQAISSINIKNIPDFFLNENIYFYES